MKDSIRNGSLVWHAMPFDSLNEVSSPPMVILSSLELIEENDILAMRTGRLCNLRAFCWQVRYGLSLSPKLSQYLNQTGGISVSPPFTASSNDVPGVSRSILPYLSEYVRFKCSPFSVFLMPAFLRFVLLLIL